MDWVRLVCELINQADTLFLIATFCYGDDLATYYRVARFYGMPIKQVTFFSQMHLTDPYGYDQSSLIPRRGFACALRSCIQSKIQT